MLVKTSAGDIAAIDYGGSGVPVLLLHDVLENAEIWRVVGERLAAFCHPIALDSFGHGQTRVPPPAPERAHELLGEVVSLLGLDRPLLVGQGVGGWALTACHIEGRIPARGLLLLEAAYPGTREQTADYLAQFVNPEMIGLLRDRFLLGATASSDAERAELVAQVVAASATDWTQSALHPEVVRAQAERSFIRRNAEWVRQPVAEHLEAAVALPRTPYPGAEAYAQVTVPMWLMMASDGVYHDDPAAAEALVQGRPDRRLMVLPTARNISATHPDRVVGAVRELLDATDRGTPSGR